MLMCPKADKGASLGTGYLNVAVDVPQQNESTPIPKTQQKPKPRNTFWRNTFRKNGVRKKNRKNKIFFAQFGCCRKNFAYY